MRFELNLRQIIISRVINWLFVYRHVSEKGPIDSAALTKLMKNPLILRIVSILDITSLSILELFEYGLNLKDVNYAMANGVIAYDRLTEPPYGEQMNVLGIPLTGDYYYSFLNSKVKLTELGIYILESIRSTQSLENKSPMLLDDQSFDSDPRHAFTIG